MIRPMRARDESAVRDLVRLCHPSWQDKPEGWYRGRIEGIRHHTLVAEQDGVIVAYTVYGITPAGHAFGRDHGTHPAARGQGLGGVLHDARLRAARAAGATHFVGITWAANAPMIRVLESRGGKPVHAVPGFFTENDGADSDATAYVMRLEE